MEYTVVIEKRHCENSDGYASNKNCPLCVAIREQLPEFDLKSVGGDYVSDTNYNEYKFKAFCSNVDMPGDLWTSTTINKIMSGEIKSATVIFSKEKLSKEQEDAVGDTTKMPKEPNDGPPNPTRIIDPTHRGKIGCKRSDR